MEVICTGCIIPIWGGVWFHCTCGLQLYTHASVRINISSFCIIIIIVCRNFDSFPAAKSFIGIVKYLFSLPEVKQKKLAFLSMNLCQDPLENYFGCQRQRGATSDNPNAVEYYQNTQALRVVNSLCRGPVRGNCRGKKRSEPLEASDCVPLPKRRRKHKAP